MLVILVLFGSFTGVPVLDSICSFLIIHAVVVLSKSSRSAIKHLMRVEYYILGITY